MRSVWWDERKDHYATLHCISDHFMQSLTGSETGTKLEKPKVKLVVYREETLHNCRLTVKILYKCPNTYRFLLFL